MKLIIPVLFLIIALAYWLTLSVTVLKHKKQEDKYTMPQPGPGPSCGCKGVMMAPVALPAEIRTDAPIDAADQVMEESFCTGRLSADMCEPCRGKYPIDFPVPSCDGDRLECGSRGSCIQTLKYRLQ